MTTGHEEEFRRLFEEEARSRLAELAEQAIELESRGPRPDLVAAMFRNAHTLKGGAGVVGFQTVALVLHDLEQLLDDVREGRRPASPLLADAVLGTIDAVRDMVTRAMGGEDLEGALTAARTALARAEPAGPGREPPPDEPSVGGSIEIRTQDAPAPRARAVEERESIPVPVARLDELVRLVGETAAAQLRVGQLLADRVAQPDVIDEYRELTRVLRDLQEQAMRARMVSVGSVAGPLRRAARDLGRAAGKEIRWDLRGADTELDRHVLERLREPLVALVRNAVDHGIEPPSERLAAGKPPMGTIRIHAMQVGTDVIVSISDDGRGIDLDSVRETAGGRRPMSDDAAMAAIFEPGVSTREEVTGVSGRGVGLDAVRTAVEQLRGRIEVNSDLGRGTEFRISVPMTLAVLRCLIVECGPRRFAIPLPAAVAILSGSAADGISAEGRPAVWVGGDAVGLTTLADVLDTESSGGDRGPILVLSTPSGRHAFRVDALAGQRDVVVKELGRVLPRIDVLAGASIEPGGSIMLVLDATGLILDGARPRPVASGRREQIAPGPALETTATVLVVDDALTIRELQRSILERAGYEVAVAAGGDEALRRLSRGDIDLVLTDVEMPGMDGFELTRRIRGSRQHAHVPVIVLTSRAGDEDRRRGMDAGADGYMVKSDFDEHALLTAVSRLIGTPDAGGGS